MAGFYLKEVVVEVDPEAPVAEEDLAQVAVAAAVLAWVLGEGPSWTSLQLFCPQSRR